MFHRLREIAAGAFLFFAAGALVLLSCSSKSVDDSGDTEAPTVTVTSPAQSAVVMDTVDIVAEATDNIGVTAVQFFVDGQLSSTDSAGPWSCEWNTRVYQESGEHSLYAKAFDAAGNSDSSEVVTVMCMLSDDTAPGAISDLAAGLVAHNSVTLTWTSPGDDGTDGQASEYDVRYYDIEITEANWSVATLCTGEPTPQTAGSEESFQVTGLDVSTTYYFAVCTADEVPNWSDLSNVVSATTEASPDQTAPAVVTDLEETDSTSTSITISWTAPGDDGNNGIAAQYDVRYTYSELTESNWESATEATGEPSPQTAGTTESWTITGLTEGTRYYIALKTADESGNWSAISNCVSTTCATPVVVVIFPDANLETAIRTKISKPTGDILSTDLLVITSLSANYKEIADLTGLEYCINLDWLSMEGNSISDITPLAGLTKLDFVNLWGNSIVDICPFDEQETLGSGDELYPGENPLDDQSLNTCIPNLEAKGVIVDMTKK
ncbi:MAG: fibronectin type III domain-containing protein [Candidatus Zixiibacteriota bacterium]|nr:MAG: fibronectin type III domain-containing protein [candidate division Zixibacteria bacterium]